MGDQFGYYITKSGKPARMKDEDKALIECVYALRYGVDVMMKDLNRTGMLLPHSCDAFDEIAVEALRFAEKYVDTSL